MGEYFRSPMFTCVFLGVVLLFFAYLISEGLSTGQLFCNKSSARGICGVHDVNGRMIRVDDPVYFDSLLAFYILVELVLLAFFAFYFQRVKSQYQEDS